MRLRSRHLSWPRALTVGLALAAGSAGACREADEAPAPTEAPKDAGLDPADLPDEPDEPEPDAVPEVDTAPPPVPTLAETCRPADQVVPPFPVPEASGATILPVEAGGRILVVGDSGNYGKAVMVQEGTWTVTSLVLPLDEDASDDLEGLSLAPDGRILGLTSSGWLRAWQWSGEGFTSLGPATVIAPDQLPNDKCPPKGVNCGPNYEGLCLHPAPGDAPCDGFAVAKAEGLLHCVAFDDEGRLRVLPLETISVGQPDWLSGCSFEPQPPHRMVVAGNLYSDAKLWEVRGYDSPASATVSELPFHGEQFNQEAVVFTRGGLLLSIGDTQGLLPDALVTAFDCSVP